MAIISTLDWVNPKQCGSKTLDGGIAVAICLRDEDMERLREDKKFSKYGRYIGDG